MTRRRAYIKFKEHEAATLYLDAEGETAARWSEAERAAQRSHSVYGADIHAAFAGTDGDVLRAVLDHCGVKKIWMQSQVQEPWGEGAPPLEAVLPIPPFLHFCIECEMEQLEDVRATLGEVLQDFHERATKWLRAPPPVSRKQRMLQRFYAADPADETNPMSRRIRARKKKAATVPRVPRGKSLVWDPATGKYVKEDLPVEVLNLIDDDTPATQRQSPVAARRYPTKVKTELAPDTPHGRPPPRSYVKRELWAEHDDTSAGQGLAAAVPAYEEEPQDGRFRKSESDLLEACRNHLSSKPDPVKLPMPRNTHRSRSPRAALLGALTERVASSRWKPRLNAAEERAAQAQKELADAQSEINALREQLQQQQQQTAWNQGTLQATHVPPPQNRGGPPIRPSSSASAGSGGSGSSELARRAAMLFPANGYSGVITAPFKPNPPLGPPPPQVVPPRRWSYEKYDGRRGYY
mmetsp:Transcript_53321/g.88382  ORF Transcript_53321/g.88382 Transcript_53321/m.88382 type:complete len:465 (-) Transcript_53321:174-1568(-)